MLAFMRTTLTLDDDVAAKLRAEARKSGRSFKETVNGALRLGLSAREKASRLKPFKVKAKAMGLRPGLNYDNIEELFDQLDGPARLR
jgi:plasmid stability protein